MPEQDHAASLLGLGAAVPEHSIEQSDALAHADRCSHASEKLQSLAQRIYKRSGVEKRHSVLLEDSTNGTPAEQSFFEPAAEPAAPEPPSQGATTLGTTALGAKSLGPTTQQRMRVYEDEALPLAGAAATRALGNAGVEPVQITHLVTVSCTGFSAPGVDIGIIQSLGLKPSVARTHIGFMGCHGALNGLRVAKSFCESDPDAVVLLVAVELCSLHYQYAWSAERIVANSLFSDGAAAAVLGNQASGGLRVEHHFSSLISETSDAMSWAISDHGFDMTLSPQTPRIIQERAWPMIEDWLASIGYAGVDEIGGWAIHPGGPKIIDACAAALPHAGPSIAVARGVLSRYGNMSSPTVLFELEELINRGVPAPYVMLGFGPGLNVEAALLETTP